MHTMIPFFVSRKKMSMFLFDQIRGNIHNLVQKRFSFVSLFLTTSRSCQIVLTKAPLFFLSHFPLVYSLLQNQWLFNTFLFFSAVEFHVYHFRNGYFLLQGIFFVRYCLRVYCQQFNTRTWHCSAHLSN